MKPSGGSQGKGIFITNHTEDIPTKTIYVVSQYIARPLLIDGFKFDLRIYVAVTSISPLRIYMYNEGLTRLCTEKYIIPNEKNCSRYQHLTNYSVNKYSSNFKEN